MLANGNSENNIYEDGNVPTIASHALEVVNQVNKRSMASPRRGSNHHYDSPAFYEDLENEMVVDEGEPLRLMTRVGPADDSSLQINWYKDGKLLNAASRFSTIVDRGFIVLDIHYTIEEDVGEYVCVATSQSGTAQTNTAHVKIIPESTIEYQTQLPQEMTQGMSSLERDYLENSSQFNDKHAAKSAPSFISHPPPNLTLNQGEPLHIELILEHYSDASLTTEWLMDGQTLNIGSRINATYDRGYCALNIAYCYPEDNGKYTCLAKNALGQAESESVQLIVNPEDSIVTKSNLTESSISHLKSLENPGDEYNSLMNQSALPLPPSFTSSVEPDEISVSEGSPAFFKVTIDPGNGDKLSVDWYHGDEVINTCSRLTGKLDMNTAFLNILYTLPSDSGSYVCSVFSEHGRIQTEPVTLNVQTEKSIILDPQSKGIGAIQALEAELNAPKGEDKPDDIITDLPYFTKDLDLIDQINEGDSVTLTAQVEPSSDNTLYVEWHKDDNQLINGSRMKISYERGVATLNITSAIGEDSGEYWLVARNRNGQSETNKITLSCLESEKIVTTSNLLEDSEGYRRLKEMEEDLTNGNAGDFRNVEEIQEECSPTFDVKPMNAVAGEGGPVKFLVKVSGFPSPTLVWKIDDEIVVPDSICKTYNDGSINYLEINRCNELGDINIHVTATNPLGTAEAEAILTVIPMVDFRPDLRHITPESPHKKMANLKKVECTPELNNAFRKSKPSPQQIIQIEKGTESKTKFFKSDVIETEKLYDQVAAGLRKNIGNTSGSRSPRTISPPKSAEEEMPSPPPFIIE